MKITSNIGNNQKLKPKDIIAVKKALNSIELYYFATIDIRFKFLFWNDLFNHDSIISDNIAKCRKVFFPARINSNSCSSYRPIITTTIK